MFLLLQQEVALHFVCIANEQRWEEVMWEIIHAFIEPDMIGNLDDMRLGVTP